eukprot:TRINITY_DN22624_c0_g1_i1.p2 TRINITY_DN22624_c0_g1~~TRINITY_DN22624_c0_g1_i1.p2  ORF type:complete len:105 (-),score=16.08 TRINITY_DN22624_c0_g1_i1:45-359(-)
MGKSLYLAVKILVLFCGVTGVLNWLQKEEQVLDGEQFSNLLSRRSLKITDDEPPECEFSNNFFYKELTGGVDAPVGRFPYMISIQVETNGVFRHICGGTLISPT